MSVDQSIGAHRAELDAIELLMQDQREVECLFREFDYRHTRREETDRIVRTACAELRMHDTLNSELFLPAVREAASEQESEDLLAAVEDEQRTIRDLIVQVEEADGDREERDAHFSRLARHVERHFNAAETTVFPRAKKLKGLDLVSVADRMKVRRREILAQI